MDDLPVQPHHEYEEKETLSYIQESVLFFSHWLNLASWLDF
jgi:hypothetical protein